MTPDEFLEWWEHRWMDVPGAIHDIGAGIGDKLFAAARASGAVPSLIQVEIPRNREPGPPPDGELDRLWKLTRPLVRRLRPALPGDCVPFQVCAGSASFVTREIRGLRALRDLVRAVFRSVEEEPVETGAAPLELVGVFGCYVDDDCSYNRASEILREARLRFWADALSSRHQGADARLSSTAGVVERDIPELRKIGAGSPLTLWVLEATGETWNALPAGDASSIAWNIRSAARSFADGHNGAAFELEGSPVGSVGLVVGGGEADGRHDIESLADKLHQRSYADTTYDGVIHQTQLAGERQIDFRLTASAISDSSDGAAEVAALHR